jgi:phosphatidyl-myo-inositol alpha-mannosyltransferase
LTVKIAFLHRDLPPDTFTGVAVQVDRLATELTSMGHSITVYTLSNISDLSAYRVYRIHGQLLNFAQITFPFLKRLWRPLYFRFLDFSGYDIIHIHGDGGWLPYQHNWLRTFYGTAALEQKFGVGFKSWLAQGFSYYLEKREARNCRHLTAISQHISNYLPQVNRIIPCIGKVPESLEKVARSKTATLIHVGSLKGRKRGHLAVQIWENLREMGLTLRLHLVCPPHEIADMEKYESEPDIFLHSGLSPEHLSQLYQESWIVLSLATYEGFGVTLIEAMAHGCVPLSFSHAGAVDLLKADWPESLSEIESMPDKIKNWVQDHGSWPNRKQKAIHFARNFNSRLVASQYLDLYGIITSSQPP